MGTHKLALSFCVGDFYLVGKVDIEQINIAQNKEGYQISFSIDKSDIKRLDDPEFTHTTDEAKSNVLQINFKTGEKKWV
jgi:hypothetical protein